MKQVLLLFFVLCIGTRVYAACVNRENPNDDLYEDIKCGLSTTGDKLKDSVSTVGTSLKDGTSKALEVLSNAAVKTSSAFRDGFTIAVETGKLGLNIVRNVLNGKKSSEVQNGEGTIDVRMLNTNES
jgi:hypothetical protein